MFCLTTLFNFSGPAWASHDDEDIEYSIDTRLELEAIAQTGDSLYSFVPDKWILEKSVEGDLNGDGKKDLALVIVRREESSCFADDIDRAVVVAFKDNRDGFRKAAVSQGVARLDGAMMADVSLIIERGSLVVSNLSGDRDLVVEQCRFRFNPELKKFQMIGQDLYQCDNLTMAGKEVSQNLITGDRIVEIIENGDVVSSKKTRVTRKPLMLFEQVSVAKVFNN